MEMEGSCMNKEFGTAVSLLKKVDNLDDDCYKLFGTGSVGSELSSILSQHRDILINVIFCLATGENDFNAFYDRFGTPSNPANKPIAWTGKAGYLPDVIFSLILDFSLPKKEKYKKIKDYYNICKGLEKSFRAGRKK
jgi:hypothetical protein